MHSASKGINRMLRVLTDVEEIVRMQEQFEKFLTGYADIKVKADVRRPGKTYHSETVYWNRAHQIYYRLGKHTLTSRTIFWNVFGISSNEILPGQVCEIVVEINFPYIKKKGKKPAGRIAMDDNNRVLILHDGSINVSNRFSNMFNYAGAYTGSIIRAEEIDDHKPYALCTELPGKEIISLKMISDFVKEIRKVKERIRCGT